MPKAWIRTMTFFLKEVNDVRRQPRLIISLVVGPLLMLLLFGIGYQGGFPHFDVALVVPADYRDQAVLNDLRRAISSNFRLVSADGDQAEALRKLHNGEVDIVEVLPGNIEGNITAGAQSHMKFTYKQINPLNEAWVQYLGYAQVSEINRAILLQAVARVQQETGALKNIPPEVVVSPLAPQYENLRGPSLTFMTFYAPRVLALILQHIAVTLGALSLVRERLRGTIEIFRVTPISTNHILLGKYLGFTLFLSVMGVLLVGLLVLLRTPFLGSPLLLVLFGVLYVVSSLSLGFLISALSGSDSQAVQLSMLSLLFSIFFSGFFLSHESFSPLFQSLSYALPLTSGIIGFQEIMLEGEVPPPHTWLMLGVITVVAFIIVKLIFHRQVRHL